MTEELRRRLEQSGYGRPGFAEQYDRYRPRPPAALLDLVPPLAGGTRLRLVVDLGSGTGLSTRWADRADEVVGIEPNEEMRRHAETITEAGNVRYVGASAYEPGWTTAPPISSRPRSHCSGCGRNSSTEIGRILRAGGVFCAYEYFAVQTALWEPEDAFAAVRARSRRAGRA